MIETYHAVNNEQSYTRSVEQKKAEKIRMRHEKLTTSRATRGVGQNKKSRIETEGLTSDYNKDAERLNVMSKTKKAALTRNNGDKSVTGAEQIHDKY